MKSKIQILQMDKQFLVNFSDGIPGSIPVRFPHLPDVCEDLSDEIAHHDDEKRLPCEISVTASERIDKVSQVVIREVQYNYSDKCRHHSPPKGRCIREHISVEFFPILQEFHSLFYGVPSWNRTGEMSESHFEW